MTSVDLSAQQKDFCGMSDVAVTTSIFFFVYPSYLLEVIPQQATYPKCLPEKNPWGC